MDRWGGEVKSEHKTKNGPANGFFQVEMLHRAVRNFSQDLQVEPSVYPLHGQYGSSKSILGDLRDYKGEDCTSNQNGTSEESIWGGWNPSSELCFQQQDYARCAIMITHGVMLKMVKAETLTWSMLLQVNQVQALLKLLSMPWMQVKVR